MIVLFATLKREKTNMETKTVGSANSGEGRKNGPSKKTVVAICVAAAVVVIGLVIFFVIRANSSLRASTVRFLRMQGIVELLNEKEKAISITENMRLKSGNKVRTDSQSFASLGLDDYKLISLEEKSKVVIEQKGKKLELNLENGSLYFNVTKALEEDETFNISTSTMIMGIRGTCGYINADEIFLVEGHVTIMDKDGNLIEVEEGQWLIRDRSTGKFVIKKFKMKELPLLIISELARDDTRRAEMLELCGVSEEEFWEYADTLEPAYFDWADLGRKRPESEAEPESKTEPEPAVTEPEKAPESETAVAEETTPEEAVPGETTEEAEPGEQTAKEPPEEAAQEETGDTFKITVNRVEGGTVVPSATSAKAGDVITLTVTPYNHYTLVGWNISSSAVSLPSPDTVQSPSFVMPAENITISAVFKYSVPENSFTVSIGSATGGSASADSTMVEQGAMVTITATPDTGYSFAGWTVTGGSATLSDSSAASTTFTMPAENVTITPAFTANNYTISVAAGTGGSASASASSATYGTEITLTATPDTGYSFAGWTVTGGSATLSDSSAASTTFTMPAENVTITPAFTANNYTISVAAGTGGSASASASSATYGTEITLTATPDTGYSFAGWTVTGGSATLSDSSAASTTFTMPAENVTITPAFTANNYTISVAAGTGGSASASASSAAYGTSVTLTATPDTGYSFEKWTVKSGGVTLSAETSASATFTVQTEDVSIEASFTGIPHSVSVTSSNTSWGTVSVSPANAIVGETVTLTATPASSLYVLDSWNVTGGGVTVSGNTFVMPAADVTINGVFKISTAALNTEQADGTIYLSTEGTTAKFGENALVITAIDSGRVLTVPDSGTVKTKDGELRTYNYLSFESGVLQNGDTIVINKPIGLDPSTFSNNVTVSITDNSFDAIAELMSGSMGLGARHEAEVTIKNGNGISFVFSSSEKVWSYTDSTGNKYTIENAFSETGTDGYQITMTGPEYTDSYGETHISYIWTEADGIQKEYE